MYVVKEGTWRIFPFSSENLKFGGRGGIHPDIIHPWNYRLTPIFSHDMLLLAYLWLPCGSCYRPKLLIDYSFFPQYTSVSVRTCRSALAFNCYSRSTFVFSRDICFRKRLQLPFGSSFCPRTPLRRFCLWPMLAHYAKNLLLVHFGRQL